MGNNTTIVKLQSMIEEYKVDLVAIVEPMVKDTEILSLSSFLNMLGTCTNGGSRGQALDTMAAIATS